jgi:hypothetical protein
MWNNSGEIWVKIKCFKDIAWNFLFFRGELYRISELMKKNFDQIQKLRISQTKHHNLRDTLLLLTKILN